MTVCNWYAGCDQSATTDGLCPFHWDAVSERPEHGRAQDQFEEAQRQRELAPECNGTEEAA